MEGSRAVSGRRYHRSTPPSPHIHTPLLVSPNPNPILSPNSFVRTFSTQPSQLALTDLYKILVQSLHVYVFQTLFFREYLFDTYEHCIWVKVQTGCVVMLFTIAPFFCRKFRDIWRCKVVWVGVDIISVELPLPTFLQSQDQYHRRRHHHPRPYHHHHCHHKFRHHKHYRNFLSYILLWQKSDTQFVKYFTPACFHIIQMRLSSQGYSFKNAIKEWFKSSLISFIHLKWIKHCYQSTISSRIRLILQCNDICILAQLPFKFILDVPFKNKASNRARSIWAKGLSLLKWSLLCTIHLIPIVL